MYLFKKHDGTIVEAEAGFDPKAPDFATLREVAEVLEVGKVYIQETRLVLKPKAERDQVRTQIQAKAAAAAKHKGKGPVKGKLEEVA